MSGEGRYLAGMATVALAAAAAVAVLPEAWRAGCWFALGTTLAVQGPSGWWVVRSIGTDRFLPAWVLGILLRLATVAVTGLVVVPRLGWAAAPTLLALVGLLMASLALEGIVAFHYSRAAAR